MPLSCHKRDKSTKSGKKCKPEKKAVMSKRGLSAFFAKQQAKASCKNQLTGLTIAIVIGEKEEDGNN